MSQIARFNKKAEARSYFLSKRSALSKEEIARSSAALCKEIACLPEFKSADTLLLFYPTRNEPELISLAEYATSLGKCVAFPISVTEGYTLCFKTVTSLDQLKVGTYGIREPSHNAPDPMFTEHSLCLLPALAFDRRGYRLGYGKGYYDRFLQNFVGISVGVAMNGFLCDALPNDPHDVRANMIVTETGVIRI